MSKEKSAISIFQKHLTVWVILCMVIGGTFDDNWGLKDPTGQSDEVFIEVIR